MILAGSLTLVVDGEPHELGPMEAVALPGGVEHSAVAGPDGAVMLDVFHAGTRGLSATRRGDVAATRPRRP